MVSPLQQLDGVADDAYEDGDNSDPDSCSADDTACSMTTSTPTATAQSGTSSPPAAAATTAAATPPPQLSYAEVTSLPNIQLPVPYGGVCDRCAAPPPTYRTNYGYYCEQCLKKHFFFNKQTDVTIIFD